MVRIGYDPVFCPTSCAGWEAFSKLVEGATFQNTLWDVVYFLGEDVKNLSPKVKKILKNLLQGDLSKALPAVKAAQRALK